MDIFSRQPQTPQPLVNPAMEVAISAFRGKIRHGPTHICTVCHRALFPNQVISCSRCRYFKNMHVVAACLTGNYVHVCDCKCFVPCTVPKHRMKEWICHTCHTHLTRGAMSCQAVANNLGLASIPPELEELNVLERQLIAKILPFAKIVALPKGKQRSVYGSVVCVPSEMETTLNALPRPSAAAQLLQVKLKRKIKYKGYQHFYTVNMKNVLAGLNTLKAVHPQYSDVSIDENASFESLEEDQPVEDMETDATDKQQPDDAEKEDLRPGLALDTCMQPPDIAQEVLSFGDGIFSVAPAQGNHPVSFFTVPKLEAMAFPVQFPTGQNTWDDVRQVKLSLSRYFNARLFSVDTRFARDQCYLFFAQFITETNMANESMSIQTRKAKPKARCGRRISNQMLLSKTELDKLIQNKDATRFMQPLRGTPAYWEKTLKDLFAMCRQLGKPTFFVTFSAAEMRWPEFINIIKAQQGEEGDFSELDWNEKCEILRSNPVTVMRLFEKRVDALMADLILSPSQPIGDVEDYFYRVEFQARGSPHIHMVIWIKDAPDAEDEGDVIPFIDRYISCKMPDADVDPELHKIVSEVQVHSRNHSKTCRKGNVVCRFGYPKLPMDETILTLAPPVDVDDDEEEKESNASKKKAQRIFISKQQRIAKEKLRPIRECLLDPNASFEDLAALLTKCNMTREEYVEYVNALTSGVVLMIKREPNDCWVNNYNPDLLRAWNANMDIQFVLDAFGCVVYMMSYVSKPEHEMTDFLSSVVRDVKKSDVNERDEMKLIMQAYSKHREVSAQEAVARVCSLPLKMCSRRVIFIQTDEDGVKMSLPLSRLKQMRPDEEAVWMSGVVDKYEYRPITAEFIDMNLATFVARYSVLYGSKTQSKSAIRLRKDKGFIQLKDEKHYAVIRYARFSESKEPEKYYRRLLKLYLPHGRDSDLKNEFYPTYEQFYKCGNDGSVKAIVDGYAKYYEGKAKEMDRAQKEYDKKGPIVNAWTENFEWSVTIRIDDEIRRAKREDREEQDDVPEYKIQSDNSGAPPAIEAPKLSPDFVRAMYRSLNETQASVFYAVRAWCLQRVWGQNPEPFFFFLSGGAGCGKSHVIKCVYQEATKILRQLPRFREFADMSQPAVLLAAFTGTAAFNISGKTLHNLLKLPRNLNWPYQPLGNALDEVRATLSNAEILIIDEISMVSKNLFAYVHWRFQQIKGNKKPFGGMSVLAVGDFYQLPPIGKAKPLCVCEGDVIDLWKDFQMVNLTEIMRQKDDHAFAQLLNRMRTKQKTDSLAVEDASLLTQAVVELQDCPPDTLHIFATNKEVDAHNAATSAALGLEIVDIPALDHSHDPRTGALRIMGDLKGRRSDLPDNIQAAEGARVMVIRNLDTEDGIVNGTFGTLVFIDNLGEHGPVWQVRLLGLQLDNPEAGKRFRRKVRGPEDNLVYIERYEERMSKRGVVRRQFPIKLAFGCTAHKVQGMTMTSAVVSLKRVFEAGMAYVALSRTTSLGGLRIIDFDEKKIYSDPSITAAMEKMSRASFHSTTPLLHFVKSVERSGQTLTVVHHNAQGLPTHMEDLRSHHELRLADVLCITETHLSGSSVSPAFQLEGYDLFARSRHVSYTNRADMATKAGGGVAVYCRSSLLAESRQVFHNVTDLEFSVVKVQSPVRAVIAAVYRPPTFCLDMFIPNMQCLLDSLETMDCQPVVVCGDFNEDLLSTGRKAIQEFFQSRGYSQLVSAATTEKQTLIDHIYISRPESCIQSGVLQSYYSYHFPVYCILTLSAAGDSSSQQGGVSDMLI